MQLKLLAPARMVVKIGHSDVSGQRTGATGNGGRLTFPL